MEFEKLKQMLILEAHNHFVAIAKTRPYVQFGNFVESLRRDDNVGLIESIQNGILTIIEGAFQSENDPGRALLKQSENVTQEQLNKFITDKDTSQLTGLLYPFIIQSIDKANFKNPNTADVVFGKVLGDIPNAIEKIRPMTGGTPSAFLGNFANKFLTSGRIKNAKVPTAHGQVKKNVDVPPEKGNISQGWEFRDESKRVAERKYGKAVDYKNVERDGDLVPMVEIKWKGTRNIGGGWKIKPFTEWIPQSELQAYNIADQEVFDTESTSTPLGDGTVEDKLASSTDFSGRDIATEITSNIDEIVNSLDIDDTGKQAVTTYFKRVASDPETFKKAKSAKQVLEKSLKTGNLPKLKTTNRVNPDYDTIEKVQSGLDAVNKIMSDNTPPKIATIAKESNISTKILEKYIEMTKEAALDVEDIWSKREEVIG